MEKDHEQAADAEKPEEDLHHCIYVSDAYTSSAHTSRESTPALAFEQLQMKRQNVGSTNLNKKLPPPIDEADEYADEYDYDAEHGQHVGNGAHADAGEEHGQHVGNGADADADRAGDDGDVELESVERSFLTGQDDDDDVFMTEQLASQFGSTSSDLNRLAHAQPGTIQA